MIKQCLLDLTTLDKSGKFRQLSILTSDPEALDPWVRMLNGKRELHLVALHSNFHGVNYQSFYESCAERGS
jgi:hypothetical protein